MAAAVIVGCAVLGAPKPAQADTVEACVIRATETGACVIPGRTQDRDAEGVVPYSESIRTADLYTEVTPVAGILPVIPETSADEAIPVGTAETSAMNSDPSGTARYLGTYKITGYDICYQCCGKLDGVTASGTQATVGRTCAAAANLSFGTRLWIEGIGERVVEDRGGGVKGNHIDVLVEDHAAAYAITGYYQVWVLED